MRKHGQILDHVEIPDDISIILVFVYFLLELAIVFAVMKTVSIDAHQLASVGDDP